MFTLTRAAFTVLLANGRTLSPPTSTHARRRATRWSTMALANPRTSWTTRPLRTQHLRTMKRLSNRIGESHSPCQRSTAQTAQTAQLLMGINTVDSVGGSSPTAKLLARPPIRHFQDARSRPRTQLPRRIPPCYPSARKRPFPANASQFRLQHPRLQTTRAMTNVPARARMSWHLLSAS